jgi:alpha-tubulin suppressor-like RCC1 family protein
MKKIIFILCSFFSFNMPAQKIAAGEQHCVVLCENGTVYTWGRNDAGQLGNGTIVNSSTPVAVPISGVTDVAAGKNFCVVLKNDGTVWTWGSNNAYSAALPPNITFTTAPTKIAGLANITKISAGTGVHSLVLKNDGTVWAWGNNDYGQLGFSTLTSGTNTPAQVIGLSNIVDIFAGFETSFALKSDGSLWAWGRNSDGELGLGTNNYNNQTPVQLTATTGFISISSVARSTLGLKSDGTVWGWGFNNNGTGVFGSNLPNSNTPTQIMAIASVTNISFGAGSFFIKNDGTFWNVGWQIGSPPGTYSNAPVQISLPGINKLSRLASTQLVMSKLDGSIWTIGSGQYGELGLGTTTITSVPLMVANSCATATQTGVLDQADLSSALSVFPNPANGILQFENNGNLLCNIDVFDAIGKQVYYLSETSEHKIFIDLSNNPKGIYFMKITASGKTLHRKIVLQ